MSAMGREPTIAWVESGGFLEIPGLRPETADLGLPAAQAFQWLPNH